MATAAAGIWNHAAPSSSLLTAKPQAGATNGTDGSATTTSATISANDFLTLLVTELQNQDPTAQTDPNEYVNQLVAVNSLEQLININQTLNSAVSAPTGGATPHVAPAHSPATSQTSPQTAPAVSPQAQSAAQSAPIAQGNLGIPATHPAATRVAQALSGRMR